MLEIYAGDKLVRRFLKIDKLATATATSSGAIDRPYRFGYGVLDENLNGFADEGEKRVYFEFSDNHNKKPQVLYKKGLRLHWYN